MRVNKCDFCKKIIQYDNMVSAGVGYSKSVELCEKCGKPVLDFLKKNKVIQIEKNKQIIK
jgi:hypothetical protein